jgi:hypothetical protein
MRKLLAFVKGFFFTAKVIVSAIVAPVAQLLKSTLQNKPLSVFQLVFAIWRLFVWTIFVLCVTASVGVPAIIAYLFLIDVMVVCVQIVAITVFNMKEKAV